MWDEILKYILLFIVGGLSGFINVIAGGGSLVTLPLLMGFGLPASVANGTNRISILFQDVAATIKFIRAKKLPVRPALLLSIPTIIGTVGGAMFASKINQLILNIVILTLLILMIFYIWFKPPVIKCKHPIPKDYKVDVITFIIFIIVGCYAGFIQVGSTLIWYALLTWKLKMGLISANAIKIFLNFIMTPIALIIFIFHHQVSFVDGLIIGVGSLDRKSVV